MKARGLHITSLLLGLSPLLFGSVIFWLWFFNPNYHDFEFIGLWTIVFSFPLCLIGLIISIIVRKKNEDAPVPVRKTNKVILITALNIPFALFYLWFAGYLMDTERLIVINNTSSDIKNIHVFGTGDSYETEHLKKGQSQTIWLRLHNEGSLFLTYQSNGKADTVVINGYTGPGMGGISEYRIEE